MATALVANRTMFIIYNLNLLCPFWNILAFSQNNEMETEPINLEAICKICAKNFGNLKSYSQITTKHQSKYRSSDQVESAIDELF